MGRIELHAHTVLSDGAFIPPELARRAEVLGHDAIAITDHCGAAVEEIVRKVRAECMLVNRFWKITAIPGVELTHVPAESIPELAARAKKAGAKIVVVHGETLAEPVPEKTNEFAAKCEDVDLIAHPGLITYRTARLAQEHGILLEISSRKGHCLTNGHVVRVGKMVGAEFVVNSDAHDFDDLLTDEKAYRVALGAGLSGEEAYLAVDQNPRRFLR
ncbi:MAG: histidinol phosphate phosphatase domain-containing protein [Thermoplasmata archaeon]|nr:histidinol phosphate phosphatase domain-containing protein [Thermoplasmata archaeon]